jgi:hypothetical protein
MTRSERAALHDLVAVCLCVRKHNTPEFMAYFAERINVALEALGSGDRVEWPGRWASEFRLVSG